MKRETAMRQWRSSRENRLFLDATEFQVTVGHP